MRIELWKPNPGCIEDDLSALGTLLFDCVHAGASVSFVLPFSHEDARSFWRSNVLPQVIDGSRGVLTARQSETIVGTVQLDLGTPPNQPHRAEIRKLLVSPHLRRQGIAQRLMLEAEAVARAERRWLLTLDTVTGGAAESLYSSLGYIRVGVIPQYALNSTATVHESTTVMYKCL